MLQHWSLFFDITNVKNVPNIWSVNTNVLHQWHFVFKQSSSYTFQANQDLDDGWLKGLMSSYWGSLRGGKRSFHMMWVMFYPFHRCCMLTHKSMLSVDKHRAVTSTDHWREILQADWKQVTKQEVRKNALHVKGSASSPAAEKQFHFQDLLSGKNFELNSRDGTSEDFTGRICGIFSEEQQGVWCNFWKSPHSKEQAFDFEKWTSSVRLANASFVLTDARWGLLLTHWTHTTCVFAVCVRWMISKMHSSLPLALSCLFSLCLARLKKNSWTHCQYHITRVSNPVQEIAHFDGDHVTVKCEACC